MCAFSIYHIHFKTRKKSSEKKYPAVCNPDFEIYEHILGILHESFVAAKCFKTF